MGFKECCCCCCSPTRVVPVEDIQKHLNDKQKKIMEYVGDGVMVDEIFDYIVTEKKKKSKFRFRGLGRLAGGKGMTVPAEPEPLPKRKTFRQAGRATQMGVIANSKKKKKSAIEEDEDEVVPKKKWTFRSVGKVTRLKSGKSKSSRLFSTFKAVANFIRFGPAAKQNEDISRAIAENLEEASKKKFTLKGLGKMSKLGLFKNEVADKPKQKFTLKGLGKMSKLGLFKNESEEKPKSQKFSLKGLGKLSKKLGFGGGGKTEAAPAPVTNAPPKRRKTLKSFAKAGILGGKVSQAEKVKPKPKKKWTFKALGKISKLGVAASGPKKPKKKKKIWTFRSLIKSTRVTMAATKKPRIKRKNKPPTFRFLARFSRFGAQPECTCGENAVDLYECTCPSDSDED